MVQEAQPQNRSTSQARTSTTLSPNFWQLDRRGLVFALRRILTAIENTPSNEVLTLPALGS